MGPNVSHLFLICKSLEILPIGLIFDEVRPSRRECHVGELRFTLTTLDTEVSVTAYEFLIKMAAADEDQTNQCHYEIEDVGRHTHFRYPFPILAGGFSRDVGTLDTG